MKQHGGSDLSWCTAEGDDQVWRESGEADEVIAGQVRHLVDR